MSTVPYSQAVVAAGAILVIDDNLAIREALSDLLNLLLDMPVYTAANGDEGLQIIQQRPQSIDLILLDMNMPVMNGEQTYEELQQIAPEVKVIVSSSLSRAEADRRFGEREMPTFLQKPYNTESLITVVQKELMSVQAANQSGVFTNRSENEKYGGNCTGTSISPKAPGTLSMHSG